MANEVRASAEEDVGDSWEDIDEEVGEHLAGKNCKFECKNLPKTKDWAGKLQIFRFYH